MRKEKGKKGGDKRTEDGGGGGGEGGDYAREAINRGMAIIRGNTV